VRVQAFSFTSLPIAQALASAEKRGVSVEVILDRENYSKEFTQTPVLSKAGVPVDLDGAHVTAHNKVIVIDGQTVITGSFNFTKAAQEKNAENVLILHDTEVAQAYLKNWQAHRDHSEGLNSR
jgi:phosphatidylserine/phosphatidylglycerophosphate/cardiolipin synthase-like enzyme